jgi:hypothetical protein
MSGSRHLADLQLHQPLRGKTDHLPQEAGVRALLQQLAKGNLVIGHRGGPRFGLQVSTTHTPPRTTAMAACSEAASSYTTIRDMSPRLSTAWYR